MGGEEKHISPHWDSSHSPMHGGGSLKVYVVGLSMYLRTMQLLSQTQSQKTVKTQDQLLMSDVNISKSSVGGHPW